MAYSHKYGSYTFPNTMFPADDNRTWNVPEARRPRAHGGIVLPGYRTAKQFEIRGGFVRGPLTPNTVLRDSIDTLSAALMDQPQNYQRHDDWYWRCVRVKEFNIPYEATAFDRLAIDVQLTLITADPYQYSTTETVDTWTSPADGGTRVITVSSGNEPAMPEFAITVGGSGTVTIAYTLTNNTTGESFTLEGDVTGGDVIEVDSLLGTVRIGSTDKMDLFEGVFPRLDVGANTIAIDYGTTGITSIVTTYRARKG